MVKHQLVGAFGERAVEAELLRHGWLAVNVNSSVKNAADFDIFALKNNRTIQVRVKTCGDDVEGFQFTFKPGQSIPQTGIADSDFTVLVRMGKSRASDNFYVLPTIEVRKEIAARQRDYLAPLTKKGMPRKDNGHWTLRFAGRKDGRQEGGYGIQERWQKYLDAWILLDDS